MSQDHPGHRCANRLFEWTMGIGMTFFGMHILLLPHTMESSRYAGVLLIFPVWLFALICIATGALRLIALNRNGTWPAWGPRVRAGCAIASGAILGQLAVSLGMHQSPGVWFYIAYACAEVRSVFRARRDGNGP